MSVRTAAIASLFALVACAEPTTVIGAPCPCLDGYICCVPLGQCLTEGELCPIERPPLSCDLVDAADGSSTIQCSDGSSFPGQGPTPQCGTREGPLVLAGDVVIGTAADVERLRAVNVVEGKLRIDPDFDVTLIEVRLPCLERAGAFEVDRSRPIDVALPALREVGGLWISGVTAIEAPRLSVVRGDVVLEWTKLRNLNGLTGLREIMGSIRISNNDRLESTSALSGVTVVGEGVSMRANPLLRDLAMLSSLERINGELDIYAVDQLANLDGLAQVTEIRGRLSVADCNALRDLTGLGALTTVDEEVYVAGEGLTSLDGLEALARVGGSMTLRAPRLSSLSALGRLRHIDGDLDIFPSQLSSLHGLEGLERVGGSLTISSTPLTSLDGLPDRLVLGGDVALRGNSALTSLAALRIDAVPGWVGSIEIINNDALTALDGPRGLASARDIVIEGNDRLRSVEALSGIRSVTYRLSIADNPALLDVEGLRDLGEAAEITLQRNTALTDLSGLRGLRQMRSLTVDANPNVANLDALADVSCPPIGCTVTLSANRLERLDGLRGVQDVRNLSVTDEPRLTDLRGIGALPSEGSLELARNASLRSLEGLMFPAAMQFIRVTDNPLLSNVSGLGSITSASEVVITGNPALTALDLGALERVDYSLQITRNVCLPQCSVSALRERLDASDPEGNLLSSVRGNRAECTCAVQSGEVVAMCQPGC